MQSLVCEKQHNGLRKVFTTMVREEGMFRPLRGLSAMAAGAGPAHAMYFSALEKTREYLIEYGRMQEHVASGKGIKNRSILINDNENNYLTFLLGFSAIIATMLHDGVMTPAEGNNNISNLNYLLTWNNQLNHFPFLVVKQRMQMCCSPYSTCMGATMGIYRSEGVRAFYRSYFTQLTMNIPFQAAVVTTYSLCQSLLNPNREYNPGIHFVAGAIAGSVGSAVTMPLDVCKTLLNTQEAAVLKQLKQAEVINNIIVKCIILKFVFGINLEFN